MKRYHKASMVLILIILFTAFGKSYGDGFESTYIDVRLTSPIVDKNLVNLESPFGFSIYNVEDKENALAIFEDEKIVALINGAGYIDLFDFNGNNLFSLPSDGSIIIGSNDLENPVIKVEKDRYRDFIRLLGSGNELIVVNHLGLQHYLYGVLPREMSYSSPMEALKAQAVASRSFSMSNINKHIGEGYNLCDTTHCQVYGGYEFERQETNQAVDETEGIYIYYEGQVIEAIYHASSSGYTEDSENVWGGRVPYLSSVEDIYSLDSPYSHWKINISLSDLKDKLLQNGIYIGDLKAIEIVETSPTGKVNRIRLRGSMGEKIVSDSSFRNILGNTILRSNWFTILGGGIASSGQKAYVLDGTGLEPRYLDISSAFIIDGNQQKKVNRGTVNRAMGKDRLEDIGLPISAGTNDLIIEGRGYGHGVGMSQFGAMKMAEEGFTFEEILKFYYTGVEVF
ncbi:MAG: SpoIID/LytB domain-containing protein [Tissierellaceae bacterium]